jgi:metallophosphoesterase superfamily enzyme
MERAFQCSGVPTAQLIVLGDFLHARESANADTLHAFTRWRETNRALSIVVVEGNHDRHAGTAALAAQWGIEMRAEPHWVKPFAFRHEACSRAVATGADFDPAESQYEFAGHVHPCTVLSGRVDRLRVPCYVLGPAAGLLPAFGAFTGGYVVSPSSDQAIYAIAGERVLKVPTAQQPQRA